MPVGVGLHGGVPIQRRPRWANHGSAAPHRPTPLAIADPSAGNDGGSDEGAISGGEMTMTRRDRIESGNIGYWIAPRRQDPGWLAFALNRLTGLILAAYLIVHLVVISELASGPAGWNRLLGTFGSRPFLLGDVLLIAAVVYHGLNGLRVTVLTASTGRVPSGGRRSAAFFGLVLVVSALLTAGAAATILSR